ncbi:MAG: hypothetical protein LBJ47_08045 [Tannerella sp.]|nr:hypothetical protein [Tannerella sp.]
MYFSRIQVDSFKIQMDFSPVQMDLDKIQMNFCKLQIYQGQSHMDSRDARRRPFEPEDFL